MADRYHGSARSRSFGVASRWLAGATALTLMVPAAAVFSAGPASAATVYASDAFNRTFTNGWGTADVGGAWSAGGPAFGVTPGSATVQADSTTPTNFLPSVSALDVDVVARIAPPAISSAFVDAGVAARYQAAATGTPFYQASAYYSSSSNGGNYTLELKRKPDNVQILADVPTAIPGGTPFMVRLEAQGVNPTLLRARIWAATAPEPATWTTTGTDVTAVLQAAGGVGVEAFSSGGSANVAFSSLTAGSIPAPPPAVTCSATSAACDTFNRSVSGGWGSADLGGAWNGSGNTYAVSPGGGRITANNTAPTTYLDAVSVTDVDALAKVSPPAITGDYVDAGVGVRTTSANGSYYQLSTFYAGGNNSGNYTLELKAQPANTAIIANMDTAIPGGAPIWLRLQAQGVNPTVLRARIWADGTTEPATWTATANDATPVLQGAGGVALKAFASAGTPIVSFNGLVANDLSKSVPVITWATPADIVYGTPLNTQLNATANVAGTFTYTPTAGAVLGAGASQPLSVSFIPADTAHYTNGSATVSINVAKATLDVTADNKEKTAGQANPPLTDTVTGFVNGDTASVVTGSPTLSTTATQSSPVGTYPISIAQGDLTATNYSFSLHAGTLNVVAPAASNGTSTTLSASPAHPAFGATLTYTATVTPTSTGTPTGTVSFYLDGQSTPVATVALTGGQAVFATSGLGAGTHSMVAAYSGDPNFTTSKSAPALSETVSCTTTVTGKFAGSLTVTSGSTCIMGAQVTGSIIVQAGASVDVESSTVGGGVTANNPAAVRMCNTATSGGLTIGGATGFVLIGDSGDDGCKPNNISGSLNLQHNTRGLEVIGNRVGGPIMISANSGTGAFPEDNAPDVAGNGPR